MDKLEHEDIVDQYIDSDGEVAVYNRDSNQPDDLHYDSDASEDEPRKEKNQHIALVLLAAVHQLSVKVHDHTIHALSS